MNSRRNNGFTLFELLVVVLILAMAGTVLVVSFDQTLERRKAASAEKVFQWLQAAADIAVLRSTIIGLTRIDNQLIMLAWYQDAWYKLADQQPLTIGDEISFSWSQSLVRNQELMSRQLAQNVETSQFVPYLILTPANEITPAGEISILEPGKDQSNAVRKENTLLRIHWDNGQTFELDWQGQQ